MHGLSAGNILFLYKEVNSIILFHHVKCVLLILYSLQNSFKRHLTNVVETKLDL